jgi:WD40 repeat protein
MWDFYFAQVYRLTGRLGGFFKGDQVGNNYMAPLGGQDVAITKNGKFVAACTQKTIFLWDFENSEVIHIFGGQPTSFFVSANQIFTVDQHDPIYRIMEGSMEETGRHKGNINSIAFCPSNNFIASGSDDHTIRIWDINGSSFSPKILTGHKGRVRCVYYSIDGNHLISCGDDRNIFVWEIKTEKPIKKYEGHSNSVTSLAISPDQKYLYSASKDGTIRVWEWD